MSQVRPTPQATALEGALLALFEQNLPNLHEQIEETIIRTAYRYCDRNQLQTARLLGISRNIVRARLAQFGELARYRASRGGAAATAFGRGEASSAPRAPGTT